MHKRFFLNLFLVLTAAALMIAAFAANRGSLTPVAAQTGETGGSLAALDSAGKPKGKCPLKHTDVKAEVSGRPKHIYSIWRKMQEKHLAFEQLMDIRACLDTLDGASARVEA